MIDGKYRIFAKTPFGPINAVFEFVCEENGRLKGTFTDDKDPDTHVPVKRGAYDGDSFKCGIMMPTPVGAMDVNVTGEVNGDAISGKIKALMGATKFEGTRTAE